VRWGLIDRSGREVRGGEGPNLITDQGLDQIATQEIITEQGSASAPTSFFPLITYCAVGTDNTAPAVTDTALGTEVERISTQYQTEELNRTSDGVYELTRYMEFDYAEANGNLTEWGFSYDATGPGLLFNRALFLDGVGTPEVVTKSSDYKLRIIYTLEITLSPVTLTAGAFTVTGVGTVNGDYTLLGAGAPPGAADQNTMRCVAPDLKLFSALARGVLNVTTGVTERPLVASIRAEDTDRSGIVYTDSVTYTADTIAEVMAREVSAARDSYVSSSFERTGGSWKFDTAYGNLAPIKGHLIFGAGEAYAGGSSTCGVAGYAFDFDLADEFTKDNEHTLTIGCPTVTWGRGS